MYVHQNQSRLRHHCVKEDVVRACNVKQRHGADESALPRLWFWHVQLLRERCIYLLSTPNLISYASVRLAHTFWVPGRPLVCARVRTYACERVWVCGCAGVRVCGCAYAGVQVGVQVRVQVRYKRLVSARRFIIHAMHNATKALSLSDHATMQVR